MTSGFATVKGVTSGDTLLLVGRAAAGPPPELQLTLSGVAAPRLAKGSNAVDEPFAWAARDFLRRLALGKAVSFRVDGEAAGRSFGAAWLKTGAGEPESLALLLARAGWCRAQAPAKGGGGDDEALRAAEADARAAGLGACDDDINPRRNIRYTYNMGNDARLVEPNSLSDPRRRRRGIYKDSAVTP